VNSDYHPLEITGLASLTASLIFAGTLSLSTLSWPNLLIGIPFLSAGGILFFTGIERYSNPEEMGELLSYLSPFRKGEN